jgi:hypothetical protein
MQVTTGVGKTRITIAELAVWIREVTSGPLIYMDRVGPVVYAVPRHKLGEKIRKQFIEHGVDARIFRGRTAEDPENPGKAMCLNLDAVELARKCHADVSETCCKSGKMKCRFFDRCGYQRQMPEPGDQPQVWIIASDMLFHTQKALGEPAAVIIDEAIWKKSIRGIDDGMEWSVPIDSLRSRQPKIIDIKDHISVRKSDRNWLGRALQQQENNGGVERRHFSEISADSCHAGIRIEWKCMPKIELRPGMSAAQINKLASDSNLIDDIQHALGSIGRDAR